MARNIGEMVARAWEDMFTDSERSNMFDTLLYPQPSTPMTPAERADSDAEGDRLIAEWQAQQEATRQRFLGTIVRAEDDQGEIRLTYADGRQVRLIGEWFEWVIPDA